MTGLVDARPRPLTLLFRPGTTLTVELTWPAGQLDGRTFTSTLGDQDLDVTIAGDVMSLEAAVAVTDGFADGTTADWALLEDLGGAEPEPVLVGEWVSSLEAAATQSVAVVTDASVTVAVSVFTGGLTTAALATHEADDEAHGNPAGQLTTHAASTTAHGDPLAVIATHEADDTAHGDPLGALTAHEAVLAAGVHGVVERNWATDGTAGLTRQVMTQSATDVFAASVVNRLLVFSVTGSGGDQREAWQIDGTDWADSEMRSYIGKSNALAAAPNLAQWGHIHRIVFDEADDRWYAFACWTDVIFALPALLNVGVVSWSGGSGPGAITLNSVNLGDFASMYRNLPIIRAQRVSNVTTYKTDVPWLDGLTTSDTMTVTGMAIAGFNQASGAITAIDRVKRTFSMANTGSNATDADAGGTGAPGGVADRLPLMLASRLVGNTMYVKQWRPEEPEPDWGNPVRSFSTTVSGGTPAPHSGTGPCALWVGHIEDSNQLRYGGVTCRKL